MAGGEIPDSDSTERFSCCFKNRQDTNARQESDADGSMIANQLRIYQQYMRHRNRNNGSENVLDRSSNLNSDFVLNGLSESFEEDNPARQVQLPAQPKSQLKLQSQLQFRPLISSHYVLARKSNTRKQTKNKKQK